jgi:hypothetical protein
MVLTTMMKPTTRQVFLLRITLGVIIGNAAGRTFADGMNFSGRWAGAFIYSFLPLLCIVLVQWIMLFDYLPEWWIATGLIGCIISASVMGMINFYVPEQVFRLMIRELNMFNSLLLGSLVALPQWFVLKHKHGYMWVLANGIGWLLSAAFRNLIFYIPANDSMQALMRETSFILLGLLLGLYLYFYVYKPDIKKTIEDKSCGSKHN